jgi:hypothetical protein
MEKPPGDTMSTDILLAYSHAMRYAQTLEGRLKILFSLHAVISGVSKKCSPLTDGDFELLMLAGNDRTAGSALNGLLKKLGELNVAPLPEQVRRALWQTVETRNFLAHHYFPVRGALISEEGARPYLIAELDWFSELFKGWIPALDKWTDALIKAIGIGDEERKSMQQRFEESAPELRRQKLESLKETLDRIGIEIPPLPSEAQRSVQPDRREDAAPG